jgi:TrmH family RNA methyltransferase
VEGPRAVSGALDRSAPLDTVYFAPGAERAFPQLAARVAEAGVPVAWLREGVLERIGSTVTPQPVLAVAPQPAADRDALARDGLVLAGGLGDPGNLGAVLRVAEASGAVAMVCWEGSVDAYNPKVVRASASAIFGIPVLEGWSAVEALEVLGALGRYRLGADATGGVPYTAVDFRRPSVLVLGHEAHGLAPEVARLLDGRVTIPMAGRAESLNVATAAAVLCFEAARARLPVRGS